MPNTETNEQQPLLEDVTQSSVRAIDTAVEESDSSKRTKHTPGRGDIRVSSYKYANALWKQLVKNVGKSDAKEILH
jgi:hypothetical protein